MEFYFFSYLLIGFIVAYIFRYVFLKRRMSLFSLILAVLFWPSALFAIIFCLFAETRL